MRSLIIAVAALAATGGSAMAETQPQAPRPEGGLLTLSAPAAQDRIVFDGAVWRCQGDVCRSSQVKSLPPLRSCKRLARELGPITSFSYRGVTLEGAASGSVEDPPKHDRELPLAGNFAVAATAGHVYTECARIWNPIHTDPEYARAAGLPGIILHGTATLALSVSKLAKTAKRVRCRFVGMVLMPSTLTVHASRVGDEILFETRDAKGEAVIERGRIG